MIQDILNNLTCLDAKERVNASVQAGDFALSLKTLGLQTKSDFERLCRQANSYPEWPESEQVRFRHLIQSVRVAARKEGKLFDSNGRPIW